MSELFFGLCLGTPFTGGSNPNVDNPISHFIWKNSGGSFLFYYLFWVKIPANFNSVNLNSHLIWRPFFFNFGLFIQICLSWDDGAKLSFCLSWTNLTRVWEKRGGTHQPENSSSAPWVRSVPPSPTCVKGPLGMGVGVRSNHMENTSWSGMTNLFLHAAKVMFLFLSVFGLKPTHKHKVKDRTEMMPGNVKETNPFCPCIWAGNSCVHKPLQLVLKQKQHETLKNSCNPNRSPGKV